MIEHTWISVLQALDPDKLKPGQRVLIHGGSGGVGHFAIQYAKLAGAYIITTASVGNHHFLKVGTTTLELRSQNQHSSSWNSTAR